MRCRAGQILANSAIFLFFASLGLRAVEPAPLFADHAVLQRDRAVPVWGKAEPGERVTVRFGVASVATETEVSGRWQVMLPALKADAVGRDLVIAGKNTLTLRDVCVGDVWFVSGQSNMAWKLSQDYDADVELTGAARANVRQFLTKRTIAATPADTVIGAWAVAAPETAGDFSAVAWYFATDVQRATGVTIGLINSTWGNTPVEAWIQASEKRPPSTLVTKEPYQSAAVLFNGMIRPHAPYAVRGFLWYQGESNVTNPDEYRVLFPALITSWRQEFQQPLAPFYWVQLPCFKADDPLGLEWPRLREAQSAALALPATGQAIAWDQGDVQDIHPRRKREVGRRLARLALHRDYGLPVADRGPVMAEMTFAGREARVRMTASSALHAPERELHGFELAGADRVFRPARAAIDGKDVVVSSAEISAPQAVRYAWRNAIEADLFDADGLPAEPFRSDRW